MIQNLSGNKNGCSGGLPPFCFGLRLNQSEDEPILKHTSDSQAVMDGLASSITSL
jgi:hypothetical protein